MLSDISSGSSYTYSNGLHLSGSVVKLGDSGSQVSIAEFNPTSKIATKATSAVQAFYSVDDSAHSRWNYLKTSAGTSIAEFQQFPGATTITTEDNGIVTVYSFEPADLIILNNAGAVSYTHLTLPTIYSV